MQVIFFESIKLNIINCSVSTYTFKLIGYLVDVVAGDLSDLKNINNYASSIFGHVSPTTYVDGFCTIYAVTKSFK